MGAKPLIEVIETPVLQLCELGRSQRLKFLNATESDVLSNSANP